MNVLEAIEIMKLNKQMRRKIWLAQTRVDVGLFNGGTSEITQAPYFVAKTNDSEYIGFEFKSYDVLATDWEEYTG